MRKKWEKCEKKWDMIKEVSNVRKSEMLEKKWEKFEKSEMCEEKVREVWEKVWNLIKSDNCEEEWDMWEKSEKCEKVRYVRKSKIFEKKLE